MKSALIAVLMLGVQAWGQTPTISTEPSCHHYAPNEKLIPNVPACKPLKCGKYQHVVASACIQRNISVGCDELIPAHCADVVHPVSEREWQELKEHIRKLEESICVGRNGAVLVKCKNAPAK